MEVFFGNLPRQMSAFELRRLVNHAIIPRGFVEYAGNLLKLKQRIRRLEFDVISEIKPDKVVRYGKAVIEPDVAAQRIIERLDKHPCRGNRLQVREFRNRTYGNDRRSLQNRLSTYTGEERRGKERRMTTTEYQH